MAMHNIVSNAKSSEKSSGTKTLSKKNDSEKAGSGSRGGSGGGSSDRGAGGRGKVGSGGGYSGARGFSGGGGWWDDVLSRGQMAELGTRSGGGGGNRSTGGSGGSGGDSDGVRGSAGRRNSNDKQDRDADESLSGAGSPREAEPLLPSPPKRMPRLAHSNLFWRSAVVSLVLAATNPGTVGRHLWETSPTMRCLMQVSKRDAGEV